jgi:putative ABC transport system permease protein
MFEGFKVLGSRIHGLLARRELDQEFQQELDAHLEMLTEENIRRGLPPEEARRAARMRLGGSTQLRETHRELYGLPWFENVIQDLRYGLRQLHRSPGFTAVAVVTLALGIGANTAMFSVVDAVLVKPLDFRSPSSLVMVWENNRSYGLLHNPVAPPNLFDWEQQNHCFSSVAAFLDQPVNLTGTGRPEQLSVESVSPDFFSLLGVHPMLGRGFSQGEDRPGKSNVAVLSYGLWKSKFGANPDIIGKTIQLNGQAVTVIGVTGPEFGFHISEFSFTGERPQLWAPLEVPPGWHDWSKVGRFLRVVARLKTGISLAQAQAQMNVVTANLAVRHPEYDKSWGVALLSLRDQFSGSFRLPLLILLGAVGFVLLIACANISSLLLSRAAGRRREIAIRVALGASPSRITRQLLTESLLLGLVGGALGTTVAIWATEALVHAGSASLLDLSAVKVDWRILAFALGVTLLAGLLAGFLPSLMAARGEAAAELPEGGRTSSAGRRSIAARSAFAVMEISLSLVLLAGSDLLIQSFFRLTEVDPGFQVAHLLTFKITLPDSKYRQDTARAEFFSQFLAKIRELPGAISATADAFPPFSGIGAATDVAIVGEPPRPPGEALGIDVRVIEPDYFRTMGIPLLHGRTFNDREFARQSNVVIINKTFADKYFPGKNPLGERIVIDMKDKNLPDEIVGIAGDVHKSSLASPPGPLAYWPYPELPYSVMTLLVRTATPPLSLVPAVRKALQGIDRDQPIARISTMDQLVSGSVARSRFVMLLLSAFAGLAVVLACIGIYGVTAYSVAQRTHEIGIRMALGAQKRDVLKLVLTGAMRLTVMGTGIGIAAAIVLTRFLSSLLYGVKPTDPQTFVAVSLVLTGVALLACWIPARRAMKVDPTVALRYE